MSKMTFDDLLRYLTDKNREDPDDFKEQAAQELILEILNVGADVLNRLPKERVAAMMSLVQGATQ